MLKIYIDMTKKVPSNILNNLNMLVDSVNEYHETKPLKIQKIKEKEDEPISAKEIEEIVSAPVETNKSVTTTVTMSGIPWDARIHSKSKAKKADGTWRYKRGVDKDMIAEVEKELCSVTVDRPKDESPFGAAPEVLPEIPSYQIQTFALDTFKVEMFNLINDLVNAKKVDKAYLDGMAKYLSLENGLIELVKPENSEKVEVFYNALADAGLINKV